MLGLRTRIKMYQTRISEIIIIYRCHFILTTVRAVFLTETIMTGVFIGMCTELKLLVMYIYTAAMCPVLLFSMLVPLLMTCICDNSLTHNYWLLFYT